MAGDISLADGVAPCECETDDDGPGELARLRRDAVLFCRLRLGAAGRTGAGAVMPTTEGVLPAAAVWLRVLVLE